MKINWLKEGIFCVGFANKKGHTKNGNWKVNREQDVKA